VNNPLGLEIVPAAPDTRQAMNTKGDQQ
jgi:hypothetical protein